MSRALRFLLSAQFLSAFVDNMILFSAQAVIQRDGFPNWYLQLVQATFLFSYIIFSPWVGRLADRFAKSRVLVLGNTVKCVGTLMMLFGIDPALSYAMVGAGAVIYSPAKYGILPWLTKTDSQLLKANAQVEGFTILAILTGATAGGWIADKSVALSLGVCIALYLLSTLLCLGIPRNPADEAVRFSGAVGAFYKDVKAVLVVSEGRFSLIGTSGFWLASAVLRLAVFIWLPLSFGIEDNATIGAMISLSGIGLLAGAAVTPMIVPPGKTVRVIWFGALMAVSLVCLPWIPSLYLALALQTVSGSFGGIYVIPLNSMLQRVGERTVGTGKVVAIQNFAENLFMFAGVTAFLAASWSGIPVLWSMTANGIVFCLLLFWLRRQTARLDIDEKSV